MTILIFRVSKLQGAEHVEVARAELFTDLREQYEVRLDEGLDAFVIVDGCPIVNEESRPKLIKFLCKKLGDVGRPKVDLVYMPLSDETNMTKG